MLRSQSCIVGGDITKLNRMETFIYSTFEAPLVIDHNDDTVHVRMHVHVAYIYMIKMVKIIHPEQSVIFSGKQ